MSVFLLSRKENMHADYVQRGLSERGVQTERLNVDDINFNPSRLSIALNQDGQLELYLDNKRIDRGDVSGVFVHHPRIEVSNEIGMDTLDRKMMAAAWANGISGLEMALDNSVWVNRPSVFRESSNIFKQLLVAKDVGFRIPDTCFSNDIQQVRQFAGKHKKVIIKPGPLVGVHFEGQRVLTQLVNVDLLTDDDLKHAPYFFQEYIEKNFELRIHVIGNAVLACRIDSQFGGKTKIDWRNYDIANTPHSVYKLQPEDAARCMEITGRLGLELGIIDAIVTPDGEMVFLECNSQGHWIWIEQLTGLPITDLVTEHLLRK